MGGPPRSRWLASDGLSAASPAGPRSLDTDAHDDGGLTALELIVLAGLDEAYAREPRKDSRTPRILFPSG